MLSRLLARGLFACFCQIHVTGAERTARRGAWILAANHISHFDPPLLSVATRRKIDWMAMAELFEMRAVGVWLRAIETFPADRARVDRQAVRTALARLRRGHLVGMFPEGGIRDGTRSVLGGAPLKPGLASLAHLAHAPVLPCAIVGSDRFYDRKMWLPFRRARVWIAFGEFVEPPAGLEKHEARAMIEREVSRQFQQLFREMCECHRLAPDDLPQPPARRKGRQLD